MNAYDALVRIKELAQNGLLDEKGSSGVTIVASDIVGVWITERPAIRSAAEYAARTGHRLLIDYKNPHGRHTEDRSVVVTKVRTGGHFNRVYVDAYDQAQRSPRTFLLERIERVKLDDGQEG